jgi:hypothetical protein
VRVFVPASDRRSEVLRFLAAGAPIEYFDAGEGLSGPPGERALLLLPAGSAAEVRDAALAALGPGAYELDNPARYPGGGPMIRVFGVGEGVEAVLREAFER